MTQSDRCWVSHTFIADYDSNRLFWVDAKLHVIFTSDFNGQNRQVVLTSYSNLVHPFSVAVFEVCSCFLCSRTSSSSLYLSIISKFKEPNCNMQTGPTRLNECLQWPFNRLLLTGSSCLTFASVYTVTCSVFEKVQRPKNEWQRTWTHLLVHKTV